jgi:competence protein ComEC
LIDIPFVKNKTQWLYIVLAFCFIFLINISYKYYQFDNFKSEEIFVADAKIINIYPKPNNNILKLKTSKFSCFISTTNTNLQIFDNINVYIVTSKITFLQYLSRFYAKSFNIQKIKKDNKLFDFLTKNIDAQHKNKDISSLFNALFFATATTKTIQQSCSSFGISHLVAISGFHLGILSFILYWIFYLFYHKIHSNYFPYRNKKFDLLIVVSLTLFGYLIFVDFVPSLFRAFVMFLFGIFFLRGNVKLISFENLSLVCLFMLAFFPTLLFSLSFWFSIAGVFYIFLFLKYFQNINKILLFFLFNIWIYLSLNPIIHFFFGVTSLVQLYSPLFTIGFIVFYPLELVLHIFGYGDFLDDFIKIWLDFKTIQQDIIISKWLFLSYLLISFLSIFSYKWFIILNISFIFINLWLFLS